MSSESMLGSERLIEAYRAAILLRLRIGWGRRRVWRAFKELGYEVSPNTVNHWFHHAKNLIHTFILRESTLLPQGVQASRQG